MMFPHEKREARTHGRCPGNGITCIPLSREPLATEGEATPGPDDYNPHLEREAHAGLEQSTIAEDPTAGADPFVFDDVGELVLDLELPGVNPVDDEDGPRLPSF